MGRIDREGAGSARPCMPGLEPGRMPRAQKYLTDRAEIKRMQRVFMVSPGGGIGRRKGLKIPRS